MIKLERLVSIQRLSYLRIFPSSDLAITTL
jgi:hypothetical protein